MPSKKRKKTQKNKGEKCPEEISEEERLKELGIYPGEGESDDDEEDEDSWRGYS